MIIRKIQTKDLENIVNLIKDTILQINSRDYEEDQISIWSSKIFKEKIEHRLLNTYAIVVEMNNEIVGIGNVNRNGLIDFFYVHSKYQQIGIGRKLLNNLELYAKRKGIVLLNVHASITAKPFFIKHGYQCIKENNVVIDNISLINYTLTKKLIEV